MMLVGDAVIGDFSAFLGFGAKKYTKSLKKNQIKVFALVWIKKVPLRSILGAIFV